MAVAPFENPAMATGGTGDVLAGTIGALLAQGLAPYDAARLGVYLHGLAGEAVRDRIGDAGLLAVGPARRAPDRAQAPRPDGRARAHGPPARVRRPRRGRGRPAARRARTPRARRPERGARSPIEARLAAAGLPALPRHAWLELDLDALAREPRDDPAGRRARACASSPSSRPTPTGTARSRSPGRWPRRARTGCRSPRSTRRSSCATAAIELPLLVLYPIPPEQVAAAAASAIAVSVGSGALTDAILEAAGAAQPRLARPTSRCTWRSRRGSGGAGCCPARPRRSSRASSARRASASAASGRTSRRPTTSRAPARRTRGSAPRLGRSSTRSSSGPTRVRRHLAGSGGILGADVDALGCRPARARDLRPRARRADAARRDAPRRGDPAPGDGAARAAGAGDGPAGRPRRELRAVVRDRATVADRDPAGRLR